MLKNAKEKVAQNHVLEKINHLKTCYNLVSGMYTLTEIVECPDQLFESIMSRCFML